MAGIERIKIVSEWNDSYVKFSEAIQPTADKLYYKIFSNIKMPLVDENVDTVKCTKEEAVSRYDWKEGIDVILHFLNGTKATMQEKFLSYNFDTATFEEKKSNGEPGAWYYCTAQYYFVGYARMYQVNKDISLQNWILIDLPGIHRLDATGNIKWHYRDNYKIRKNSFRYIYFNDIPEACTISRFIQPVKPTPQPIKKIVAPVQPALFNR